MAATRVGERAVWIHSPRPVADLPGFAEGDGLGAGRRGAARRAVARRRTGPARAGCVRRARGQDRAHRGSSTASVSLRSTWTVRGRRASAKTWVARGRSPRCWSATRRSRHDGGTVGRSTESCWTRHAPLRASSAAIRTSRGCVAPPMLHIWQRCRRDCCALYGRCWRWVVDCFTSSARCSRRRGRSRSRASRQSIRRRARCPCRPARRACSLCRPRRWRRHGTASRRCRLCTTASSTPCSKRPDDPQPGAAEQSCRGWQR